MNQFGGYTGLTPAGFRAFVHDIAGRVGYPADRVWFGGDHLGPNAWRQEAAATAMGRAEELVAQFVAAGFRKLHLDCSMSCADDPSPLPEATVASRAARLCAAAERAWREHGGDAPAYVIGTEVPAPGGAGEDLLALTVTTPEAAQATIEAHRGAFEAADLAAAWPRAVALVVQPGVEFDHHKVIDYRPEKARELSAYIARTPQFVFEAHSTDYQTPENLQALVRDHFAILKVGPAATFALRETLWALAAIERELPGAAAAPRPARGSGRGDARRHPSLARLLPRPGHRVVRSFLQPERPDPLLLAAPRCAARVREHARKPPPTTDSADAHEPVSAATIRRRAVRPACALG